MVQPGDRLPGQSGAVGVGDDGGRVASRSSAVTSGAARRQFTAAGSAPARIRPNMAVTQPAWLRRDDGYDVARPDSGGGVPGRRPLHGRGEGGVGQRGAAVIGTAPPPRA